MLMITSSPAPDSASSVTSTWRLSCHRPTTFALSRTLVHAVLNVVTGRVGSFSCPLYPVASLDFGQEGRSDAGLVSHRPTPLLEARS
jgi:hypothetical protein